MDARLLATQSAPAATSELEHEDAMEIELARMEASLADLCVLPDGGLLALNAWLADEQELRDISHLEAKGALEHLQSLGPAISPRVEQARQAAIRSLRRGQSPCLVSRPRRRSAVLVG